MIGVDLIGDIRRAYFEERVATKEIVRRLAVSRATVRKVVRGQPASPVAVMSRPAAAPAPATPKGTADTIAVTVRLGPDRYQALKIHGAKTRTSNQNMLVAALDLYLNSREV